MKSDAIQAALSCILLGYLIGSLSPAYLIGKRRGYDVRSAGSGNAGASNTLLLAGGSAGLLVAAADILKAASSWWLAQALFPELRLAGTLGGTACVMGHIYPLFLRFKGGKGLACIGGVIIAFDPRSFLLMLTVALAIGLLTNYIAFVTVSVYIIWPLYFGLVTAFWLGAAVLAVPALPVLLKHIENFRRMRTGEEFHLSYLWDRAGELERTGHKDQI